MLAVLGTASSAANAFDRRASQASLQPVQSLRCDDELLSLDDARSALEHFADENGNISRNQMHYVGWRGCPLGLEAPTSPAAGDDDGSYRSESERICGR